jgi:hypothetical protein
MLPFKRKKTKVQILLDVLKDGTPHLGDELAIKVGHRFGDAISKARKKGYSILTEPTGMGQKRRYLLLSA